MRRLALAAYLVLVVGTTAIVVLHSREGFEADTSWWQLFSLGWFHATPGLVLSLPGLGLLGIRVRRGEGTLYLGLVTAAAGFYFLELVIILWVRVSRTGAAIKLELFLVFLLQVLIWMFCGCFTLAHDLDEWLDRKKARRPDRR